MMVEDVYVVTGAAGGMGLACAEAVAARGTLLLVDMNVDGLVRSERYLRATGATVVTACCDVTSNEDVRALATKIEELGVLCGLVHTAGVSPEMAGGRTILEVDLVGSARVMDAMLPLVVPGSCAVLIGSIASYADVLPVVEATLDDPLKASFLDDVEAAVGAVLDAPTAYVLAKRGVVRLVERLAATWGDRGGRTVAISPGLIDTPMGRLELSRQPIMPAMIEATPIKRPEQQLPGRASDIAAVAAFLLSRDASFISGCDLRVDGGLIGASRHLHRA